MMMSFSDLKSRLAALRDYQVSMARIGEESAAADREQCRVILAISMVEGEIKRREAARTVKGEKKGGTVSGGQTSSSATINRIVTVHASALKRLAKK